MRTDRRRLLKGGSLAALGAGFLSRFERTAAAQGRPPSLKSVLAGQARGASEKMLLGPRAGEEGPPAAATADRLPRAWNEATVRRFKETLAERDIRAFLVRDPLNVIYLTGYWHTTTERPQAVYMNADDTDPWFLYPGLDRDIVTTWWFGGGWMYFDYLHGEGAFPHEGRVQQGSHRRPLALPARRHPQAQGPGDAHRRGRRAVPVAARQGEGGAARRRVGGRLRRPHEDAPGQDARGAGALAPRLRLLRPRARLRARLHPHPRHRRHRLRGGQGHRDVDQRRPVVGPRPRGRQGAPRRGGGDRLRRAGGARHRLPASQPAVLQPHRPRHAAPGGGRGAHRRLRGRELPRVHHRGPRRRRSIRTCGSSGRSRSARATCRWSSRWRA